MLGKDSKKSGSGPEDLTFVNFDRPSMIETVMSDYRKPMAHEEAEETHAVESYLLDELTEEQRLRFEEHYFECTSCADAVMAGQVFIQGIRPTDSWGKRLAAGLNNSVSIPAWRLWAAGGAVAASLTMFTVQNMSSPPLAMANTTFLAKEDEKGAAEETGTALATPSATVEVELYDQKAFPFYRMTISSDKGDVVSKVLPAPAQKSGRRLSLQVAAKALGAGVFTVSLSGLEKADASSSQQLGTYHFSISQSK